MCQISSRPWLVGDDPEAGFCKSHSFSCDYLPYSFSKVQVIPLIPLQTGELILVRTPIPKIIKLTPIHRTNLAVMVVGSSEFFLVSFLSYYFLSLPREFYPDFSLQMFLARSGPLPFTPTFPPCLLSLRVEER